MFSKAVPAGQIGEIAGPILAPGSYVGTSVLDLLEK